MSDFTEFAPNAPAGLSLTVPAPILRLRLDALELSVLQAATAGLPVALQVTEANRQELLQSKLYLVAELVIEQARAQIADAKQMHEVRGAAELLHTLLQEEEDGEYGQVFAARAATAAAPAAKS